MKKALTILIILGLNVLAGCDAVGVKKELFTVDFQKDRILEDNTR